MIGHACLVSHVVSCSVMHPHQTIWKEVGLWIVMVCECVLGDVVGIGGYGGCGLYVGVYVG